MNFDSAFYFNVIDMDIKKMADCFFIGFVGKVWMIDEFIGHFGD
jgi:hypothetical protein